MSVVCWCLLALPTPPLHPQRRDGCFLFLSGADPLSGTPPAPPPSLINESSGWGREGGFVRGCFQEARRVDGGGALMGLGSGGGNLDTDPCLPPPPLPTKPLCCVQRLSDLQHSGESAYSGCIWLAGSSARVPPSSVARQIFLPCLSLHTTTTGVFLLQVLARTW